MRLALSLAGLATLLAACLVSWDSLIGHFPAHMLRHALLVAVVPPFLVLALAAPRRTLRIPPGPASLAEALIVWAWHLPALHLWARGGTLPEALEQASFLIAGLFVWSGAMRGGQPLAGAAALLFTSMHMTLLGALLILAPRVLYDHAGTALAAQQAGGIIMLALATPAYLIGGLALIGRLLSVRAAP